MKILNVIMTTPTHATALPQLGKRTMQHKRSVVGTLITLEILKLHHKIILKEHNDSHNNHVVHQFSMKSSYLHFKE